MRFQNNSNNNNTNKKNPTNRDILRTATNNLRLPHSVILRRQLLKCQVHLYACRQVYTKLIKRIKLVSPQLCQTLIRDVKYIIYTYNRFRQEYIRIVQHIRWELLLSAAANAKYI